MYFRACFGVVAVCVSLHGGDENLRPAALILTQSPGSTVEERDGQRVSIPLSPGSELYRGDKIQAGSTPLAVSFCPATQALEISGWVRPLAPGEKLSLDSARFRPGDDRRIPFPCLFPNLRDRRAGTLPAMGGAPKTPSPPFGETETQLSTAGVDLRLPALTSLAVSLEQREEHVAAWQTYEKIANDFSGAHWARRAAEQPASKALPTLVAPEVRAAARAAFGPPEDAQTFALIIGISKYMDGGGVKSLQFADRDAERFRDFLRSPRGGLLRPTNIVYLTNEEATKSAIETALKSMAAGRASEGQKPRLIFFVAGHGFFDRRRVDADGGDPEEDDGRAYLLAHNSNPNEPDTSAVSFKTVTALLLQNATLFRDVIVIADVCHAGVLSFLSEHVEINDKAMKRGTPKNAVFAMASSRDKSDRTLEFAHESPDLGHGLFTYYLLSGLNKTGPKGSSLTLADVFDTISPQVRAVVKKQIPSFTPPTARNIVVEDASVEGLTWPKPPDRITVITPKSKWEPTPARSVEPDAFDATSAREEVDAIISRYLRGDQEPQKRADFERCSYWLAALIRSGSQSAYDRSRQAFCEARALLFERQIAARPVSFGRAAELLNRSIALDPDRAYSYNALGIAYLESASSVGRNAAVLLDRAVLAFREAVRRAPYWPYARHNLALALAQEGDTDGALTEYREAIRLRPQYFYLRYNLGLLLQRLNLQDEAADEFRAALRLAEDHQRSLRRPAPYQRETAAARNAIGTLQRSRGRALRWYRQALEADPSYAPARHNRALILRERGLLAEAITEWKRALADEPEFVTAELSYADALSSFGAYEEAARVLIASHARLPSVSTLRELGVVHARARRLPEAVTVLEEALKLKPHFEDVQREIEDIRRLGNCTAAVTDRYRALKPGCRVPH